MTMASAVRLIFGFFGFIVRKARRTRVFIILGALPMLAAAIIQAQRWISGTAATDGLRIFSSIMMAFYLQFLILVLALFFGTSICSEEVENKTLTYLTTRPVSKPAILVGKFAAYTAFAALLISAGVLGSFILLNFDGLGDLAAWGVFLQSLGVLLLGLVVYSAVFTFIGTFLKKSVLFGLFFSFGWESVVQYFPGSTQKFTLMHYLKSLLRPESSSGQGLFSFLFFRLEPSSVGTAIVTLLLVTIAALFAAAVVFSRKEYLFEE